MAMFGQSAPRPQSQGGNGLRWWDYALGLMTEGKTFREINNEEEDRRIAQERAAEERNLRNMFYNQAFGDAWSPPAAGRGGDPVADVDLYASGAGAGRTGRLMGTEEPYQTTAARIQAGGQGQGDAADTLLGVDPARAAQIGGNALVAAERGGIPAAVGAVAQGAGGIPGSMGQLLYRPDGSLRSQSELLGDRRIVGLMMDPSSRALIQPWLDAAEERKEDWQFQNGQFFNVNSADPLAGARRAGTAVDVDTGMWVDANGVAHQAEGFNATNATRLESNARAEGRGQNATYRDRQAIDLEYAPRIRAGTAAAEAAVRRQFEPGTAALIAAAEAPYQLETVQGYNGPITMSRAEALRGGPIQGRDSSVINAQNEANSGDRDFITTAQNVNGKLNRWIGALDNGTLNLSLGGNLLNQGRNWLGASSQDSRNFASFRADMAAMRNESLRLNAGVQTEGDAQRAWDELFANLNDEGVVRQRLAEIAGYNTRAIAERQARIAERNRGNPNQPQARGRYNPATGRIE